MDTVQNIADRVGRRVISDRVGVRATAVSNAVMRGKFPAAWFFEVSALCAELGVECPATAFSFKDTSKTSLGEEV